MKKSLLNILGVAAITLSAQVSAAGIGGINVVSALGQPLRADIELLSVNNSEKSSLVARLAAPDAYKAAGLDYPYGSKFKFDIETRANGESFIHATTLQPVNDPFVTLLVELSWSSGKLVREFTFLLDPVGYQAVQPAPAPVQAVAPVVQPVADVAPEPVAVAMPEPKVEAAAVESAPLESPAETKPITQAPSKAAVTADPVKLVEKSDLSVKRGDNLSKIAAAHQVEGVSLERMLVALYRANADQFDGKNMNRIRTGKILRLPDAAELEAVTQSEARKEIHAQVSDWNAYRQKIAGAAPASTQQETAQQVSAGKISSNVSDKAPVAKEGAKEVLKLSKGETSNDKTGVTGKAGGQDKSNAAQEDAIAKSKAAEDESKRVAMLEKQVQDMARLAELKTQAAALANNAPVVASAVAAVSEVSAVSAVESASAVVPAQPKLQAQPVVVETSLVDDLLAEPLYLAGGLVALLGLGGLAFMRTRRSKLTTKKPSKKGGEGDIGAVTGRIAAPVVPSPDTGDFTIHAGNTQTLTATQSDDDPISEADLFLSFGRDAQAEEILKEALQTATNKTPIRMKLLEIYVSRKDAKSFEGLAKQLKSSVDDTTWEQVATMGRKIDPQNALYGGSGAKVEDSESATMQTAALATDPNFARTLASSAAFKAAGDATAALDLDLAATQVFTKDEMATAKNAVMDMDVTATNPSMPAAQEMDFDVTATHDKIVSVGGAAEKLPNLDELVFDITSTHPSMPAVQPEAAPVEEDKGMAFTLDFPVDSGKDKVSEPVKAAEFNLSDISLDMGDEKPMDAKPANDSAQWHEVATKLDLAKAYQEMGDPSGAREILEEVLREGDDEQRATAQEILKQLA